jgi:hypothetical protein
MYLSNAVSEMLSGPDGSGIRKPADTATAEPWDLAASPAYRWGLLADAALERGDAQEAAEMIQFAYWAADAGNIIASDGYLD